MPSLSDWKETLFPEWQIYALIDPLADNKPLQHWYQQAATTDAWPLYAGTEFADDLLYGPWLLPLAQLPDWATWWSAQEQAGYATGILIASEHPPQTVLQHWQSLLIAGLEGEEVLFRYYDPRILGPMLFTFHEEETRRFLGPTNEILLWYQDDWLIAAPHPEPELTEHHEPWWRMKESHFVGQPGEDARLTESLDDYLWQNHRLLMQQWYQSNDDLKTVITSHIPAMHQADIPKLYQPIWLILQLFDYSSWWPSILTHITQDESDEQTELMNRTLAAIQHHKERNIYGE
jgi:hypothetical protein